MRPRTFEQYVVPRPRPRWTDAVTYLRHFALVTYTVDPGALEHRLPPRLTPLTVELDGTRRALVSVVSFVNDTFRPATFPFPGLHMAQMNYRVYVLDETTGRHGIWFLAVFLDGWAYAVPRFLWKMPWYKAPMEVHVEYVPDRGLYESYAVMSTGDRAPAYFELTQSDLDSAGDIVLPGFPDPETGLVCLTHIADGFFRTSDGKVGLNRVWHKPIPVRPARLRHASFPLLERMGLVPRSRHGEPYSVLLAPGVDMLTRLPPTVVSEK